MSPKKKEPMTTQSPTSGPTDRYDSTGEHRAHLTISDKSQSGAQQQHFLDVEGRNEAWVVGGDIGRDRQDEHGQHSARHVVSGHEGIHLLTPAASRGRSSRIRSVTRPTVRSGGDHQAADLLFRDVGAGELTHDMPAREDEYAVAQSFELESVGRHDDDRGALIRDVAENPVDLHARANVDAGGRFFGEDQRGLGKERSGEHDLLLVAARERADIGIDTSALDGQIRPLRLYGGIFLTSAHETESRQQRKSGERRILPHRQTHEQSFLLPIGREVANPCLSGAVGAAKSHSLLEKRHSSFGGDKASQSPQELALAVARDARDSDDLAAEGGHRDVVEILARKPGHRQANRVRLRRRPLRRKGVAKGAPYDEAEDLVVRDLVDPRCALDLAIPHHRDPISDLTNLLQAVRNINDGRASGRRRPDFLEKDFHKIRRERRGGLVEDQDLGFNRERFRKFVELALRDIDLAHPHARIDRRTDLPKLCSNPFRAAAAPQPGWYGEKHVLGDCQFGQHGRVLVNDGETEMLRLGRSEPFDRRTADLDRAGIGTHHARCDAHQGRFSCAILAQERVDFAALRLKGNVLHGDDAGVSLRHMGQAQRRVGILHNTLRCDLLLDERHENRPRLQKSDVASEGGRAAAFCLFYSRGTFRGRP
jgi:hypothetical protein